MAQDISPGRALTDPLSGTTDLPPDAAADGIEMAHTASSGRSDPAMRAVDVDHRPVPVARGAVAQIAEAVRQPTNGTVEIRLSPEELGRVTLSMVPGDAGLMVQLVAERPETLELLRRHVDLLAADLQDLGYSGLEFSFGREGRDGSGDGSAQQEGALAPSGAPESDTTRRSVRAQGSAPDGRLDIRL